MNNLCFLLWLGYFVKGSFTNKDYEFETQAPAEKKSSTMLSLKMFPGMSIVASLHPILIFFNNGPRLSFLKLGF